MSPFPWQLWAHSSSESRIETNQRRPSRGSQTLRHVSTVTWHRNKPDLTRRSRDTDGSPSIRRQCTRSYGLATVIDIPRLCRMRMESGSSVLRSELVFGWFIIVSSSTTPINHSVVPCTNCVISPPPSLYTLPLSDLWERTKTRILCTKLSALWHYELRTYVKDRIHSRHSITV